MTTVLITQCLQRESADPIGPHDPLANLLPVGYSEAARLFGQARRRDGMVGRLSPNRA